MTVQFDTLSFAKRLTAAGEKIEIAEAHAMAFKDFVMDVIATKADVSAVSTEVEKVRTDLSAEIGKVRTDLSAEIGKVRTDLNAEIGKVRTDLSAEIGKVRGEIVDLRTELKFDIAASEEKLRGEMALMRGEMGVMRNDLRKEIETLGLSLTVRMGGMLVVAVGVLASLRRFF